MRFANSAQPDETLPLHWKNSIRFAIGGIYSITDNIGFRAGVSYDETPTSITFRSADLPDSNEIMGSAGVSYRFVPDKYDMYAAASRMMTLDGLPVMEVRLTSLEGWGAVGKRVFDVVGSIFLIFVFSPLLIGIAIAQKVAEPSAPIFYFQKRVGYGGRQIGVVKFRSTWP